MCSWQTIHTLTSKICPKFQVLSFTFLRSSEVSELLELLLNSSPYEHWAKIEEKIFQLQCMSNAIIFSNERFAVQNSALSFLALMFSLSVQKWRSWFLHAKNQFNVVRHDKSQTGFSVDWLGYRTYGFVVKASCIESGEMSPKKSRFSSPYVEFGLVCWPGLSQAHNSCSSFRVCYHTFWSVDDSWNCFGQLCICALVESLAPPGQGEHLL